LSLYLISKEPKLINRINNQLRKPCHSLASASQLKQLPAIIDNDPHPFIIVDDTFYAGGYAFSLAISCVKAPKLVIIDTPSVPFGTQHLSEFGYGAITTPFTIEELVESIVDLDGAEAVIPHLFKEQLQQIVKGEEVLDKYSSVLIGNSPQMVEVRQIIETIGPRFSTVHISGETGTGKEIVANLLFQESRCEGELVVEDCSKISENLADSHLFGSVKGAYTDSKYDRPGILKKADRGVLFLDEIENLELTIQGKFLRLLETKRFRPVGSDDKIYSDFKLITASNCPLGELYAKGAMRFDFINRINDLTVYMPPLRRRLEDIPLLVEHYLKSLKKGYSLDQETLEMLMGYSWPGNVRELFRLLDRLVLFAPAEGKVLSHRDIIAQTVYY